ncbi:nitrous oxide reductase accessory protein NosL [Hugenholtzia roseola]|uniref:nitrous oxide reductase accessory protein NosL n=1 Tax=Hugenholtzia roseola TaxID=1002 RepID=UPI000684FFFE|nr:nitrous oxide reductase accessory protein NosL [Hugenholtzia roseola]
MKKISNHLTILVLLSLLFFSACAQKQDSGAQMSQQEGMTQTGTETGSETNTEINYDCVNCGMPSQDFPNWQALVKETGGKEVYFCAPRCLFMHLSEEEAAARASEIRVVNYYKAPEKIDAKTAFFVTGSDVTGPMGVDFVPFANQQDAEAFKNEHQGKQIYSFSEITPEVLKAELGGKKHQMAH